MVGGRSRLDELLVSKERDCATLNDNHEKIDYVLFNQVNKWMWEGLLDLGMENTWHMCVKRRRMCINYFFDFLYVMSPSVKIKLLK